MNNPIPHKVMPLSRNNLIDAIIHDLQSLKKDHRSLNRYAIDENIRFFEATRSFRKYFYWLFSHMSKVDGEKLLELSDFNIGQWQTCLQQELVRIERWKFPDILRPLRKAIISHVEKLMVQHKRPLVLVSLGSGAMETERQVIEVLQKQNLTYPVLFVCIDNSQASIDAGFDNIRDLGVQHLLLHELNSTVINTLPDHLNHANFLVAAFRGDALSLDRYFAHHPVDLIYYSKFKHHLRPELKQTFTDTLTRHTNHIIEFDDYRGLYLIIFSLLTNWSHPVLLNGAVFSCLRDPDKKTLKKDRQPFWKTSIIKPFGGYLKIYSHDQR